MRIEGKQISFVDKIVGTPYETITPLLGTRTIVDALTDDFFQTVQKIRQFYLPFGSTLLINDYLLEEALSAADGIGSLYDERLESSPLMNLALAANLQTLRKREIFLERAKSELSHLVVAHLPGTPEWENEIRMSTDGQFWKMKTKSPEDNKKFFVPWTSFSTEAIWCMSTVFYPTPSADLADRIAGEDWITAELFAYYWVFLKNKARRVKKSMESGD